MMLELFNGFGTAGPGAVDMVNRTKMVEGVVLLLWTTMYTPAAGPDERQGFDAPFPADPERLWPVMAVAPL
jgi:hypothetical protein